MKFSDLTVANRDRLASGVFKHAKPWGLEHWALAVAGEAGELANATKKVYRGDGNVQAVKQELADVVIYCDLLAQHLGVELSDLVRDKFNEKSREVGSTVFIA